MRTRIRGFTLIELLVVVAIIALLIAILLPSLGKARNQAKRSVCLSNTRSVSLSAKNYMADWQAPLPYATTGSGFTGSYWTIALVPYGHLEKMRQCPSAKDANPHDPSAASLGAASYPSWQSPVTISSTTPGYKSGDVVNFGTNAYGLNGWTFDSKTNGPPGGSVKGPFNQEKLFSTTGAVSPQAKPEQFHRWTFKSEAAVPFAADCSYVSAWPYENDAAPTLQEMEDPTAAGDSISTKDNQMRRFALNRHDKAINISFLDGHGETVKIKDLWTLKWTATWSKNTPQTNIP